MTPNHSNQRFQLASSLARRRGHAGNLRQCRIADVFDFVASEDVLPKILTGYGLVPAVAFTSDVSGPGTRSVRTASCTWPMEARQKNK